MYHYVHDSDPFTQGHFRRTLSEFAAQLDYFAEAGIFVTQEEVKSGQFVDGGSPRFLLTFDDGLKDHVRHVLPVLLERKIFGMFFCPSQPLQGGEILDVQKIQLLLATLGGPRFVSVAVRAIGSRTASILSNLDFHVDAWETRESVSAVKLLLQRELEDRSELVAYLFNNEFSKTQQKELKTSLYMDMSEVRLLASSGMLIGNHSTTHPWLGHQDLKLSLEEVLSSQRFLESEGLASISNRFIAYPYGDSNLELRKALESEGFLGGFTTIRGSEGTSNFANKSLTLHRWDTNDWPF